MTLSPDEIEKVARAIDPELWDWIDRGVITTSAEREQSIAKAQAALSALFPLVVERCARELEDMASHELDRAWSDAQLHSADKLRSLSPSAGSAWRPIEEAPRDGTRIILAKIIPADEEREAGIWWACAGRWQAEAPLSGTGGKIRRQAQWTDGIDNLGDPTHFMPLPSPPSTDQKPSGAMLTERSRRNP